MEAIGAMTNIIAQASTAATTIAQASAAATTIAQASATTSQGGGGGVK